MQVLQSELHYKIQSVPLVLQVAHFVLLHTSQDPEFNHLPSLQELQDLSWIQVLQWELQISTQDVEEPLQVAHLVLSQSLHTPESTNF